jgi:membrane-bound ClpP family serine protease
MDSTLSLAYTLIGAGFLLIVAELFIPSGGILSVLSAAAILVGVTLAFKHDTRTGMWTLLGVGIALPVALAAAFHFWPKTPIGKRLFLTAPDPDATVAASPERQELELLRGQIGRTLSSLRPAGVVDFGGKRIDCITEGTMVGQGETVRCVDVKAGRVIVRPVEKPQLETLESADFE